MNLRSFNQASEKNPGILRFGSLSVKVKKTTEAFNNYFGERKHSWGSNSSNHNSVDGLGALGGGGGIGGGGGSGAASMTSLDSVSCVPEIVKNI